MSPTKLKPRGTFAKARREEAWEFRLILAVSFVFCLAGACIARLLPRRQASLVAGQQTGVSVFSEARSAAYAAAGYAVQR
ncbi:MAG: hypothetical protein H2045_02060 [Rhizobiales bacterium]|nr:hypothetical protein [Hyphomicrobiales bacterium]